MNACLRTRVLSAAALAAVLLVPAPAVAAPAEAGAAAPKVRIERVYFDSPGADRGGSVSLNAEYVRLVNAGSSTVSLEGFWLRDKTGYRYTFGDVKLARGKTVTLHTGKGKNRSGHVYWGRGWYVWNNTGDEARLYFGNKLVDSCKFTSRDKPVKRC